MKRKKNAALIAVIAVFGAALLISGGILAYRMISANNAEDTSKGLSESLVSWVDTSADPTLPATEPATQAQTPAQTEAPATEAPVPVENPVNFEELLQINPDVYSWITVPDTNIDYPVAQSDYDDNFYLSHDVYKNYSFPGTIYSQSCNKKDYSDRVTVLYGHNMLNGSMFANEYMFMDKAFFDSHPYFYVYTADRKLTYEVVSVFEYDDRHIMNSFDFSDDKVFQDWIDATLNPRSLYCNVREGVKLDLNSKLLVLSTCLNSGDGRLLLEGVLIKDEPAK